MAAPSNPSEASATQTPGEDTNCPSITPVGPHSPDGYPLEAYDERHGMVAGPGRMLAARTQHYLATSHANIARN